MSIIYDALQKTQQSLGNKPIKTNWISIVMVVIIVFLLIVIIWGYYVKYFSRPQFKPKYLKTTKITLPKPTVKLILQGVFVSDHEKIALINNRTLHVGDSIEGKKIISIDFDKVKVQDGNSIRIIN